MNAKKIVRSKFSLAKISISKRVSFSCEGVALRASAVVIMLILSLATFRFADAQDDQGPQGDPPSRVARLGYVEGSVSFQPAGEQDWVQAVPNRPMTTGDKLWADQDSRAELQLGSAVIRLSQNTGVSFLNLDDNTIQLELSSGAIDLRVRRLDRDDVVEVDTPNLAFTASQPGSYRLEASEDGGNTIVAIRAGDGEATGNGQSYNLHAGQRTTFNGTDSLNADVETMAGPDDFDTWSDGRDRRYDDSRSAQYCAGDVVGYQDLDDYGDWRQDPSYGEVWYPSRVEAGWAPYRMGHWDWIDPWGYTWVDDEPWGYAPFHYGRWAFVSGRWGWIPGPRAEEPVYAPALVVFVGGGGGGFGGNIGWFPLGPREVYVPSYQVSRGYMSRVNVSSTTVNVTTVTNVYNTTIVNRSANITNVTYANRNVQGAVTAVPQRAFVSSQPVARSVVKVDARQISAVPVSARVAVNPTRESVLGARASTAGKVKAPPAAVVQRQVVAKKAPPPPPVPFAQRQQAMAAHPGQPLPRQQLASLRRPAETPHPAVKMAPPGKPATPTTGQPNRPGAAPSAAQPNRPGANRPGQPSTVQPNGRPEPNRPPAAQPPANQPEPNRPPAAQPNNRPEPNRPPEAQPNSRPEPNRPPAAQPNNRPEPNQPGQPPRTEPNNRPQPNRPPETPPPAAQPGNRPAPNRPPEAQPNNRPEPNRPAEPPRTEPNNRPQPNRPPEAPPPAARPENRPTPNRPPEAQPNNRPEPNRPPEAQPNNRPEPNRPPEARPPAAQPENRPASRPPQTQPENRPAPNRPPEAQPNRPQPNRPPAEQPKERPQERTAPSNERQAQPPNQQREKPKTPPDEKKRPEDQKDQQK